MREEREEIDEVGKQCFGTSDNIFFFLDMMIGEQRSSVTDNKKCDR